MTVICVVKGCKHNQGGHCNSQEVYITDVWTGKPVCMSADKGAGTSRIHQEALKELFS